MFVCTGLQLQPRLDLSPGDQISTMCPSTRENKRISLTWNRWLSALLPYLSLKSVKLFPSLLKPSNDMKRDSHKNINTLAYMFDKAGSFGPKSCTDCFSFKNHLQWRERWPRKPPTASLALTDKTMATTQSCKGHTQTHKHTQRKIYTYTRLQSGTDEALSAQEQPLLGQNTRTSSPLVSKDIPGCNLHPSTSLQDALD